MIEKQRPQQVVILVWDYRRKQDCGDCKKIKAKGMCEDKTPEQRNRKKQGKKKMFFSEGRLCCRAVVEIQAGNDLLLVKGGIGDICRLEFHCEIRFMISLVQNQLQQWISTVDTKVQESCSSETLYKLLPYKSHIFPKSQGLFQDWSSSCFIPYISSRYSCSYKPLILL